MKCRGSSAGGVGRASIRTLDALLRRAYGVYEFTQDPDCILRLSLTHATQDLALADGTPVAHGDRLAVIHFWNERLPPIAEHGVDLRWAREMYRTFRPSLQLLGQHLAQEPVLAQVRAVCGEATFIGATNVSAGASLLARLGFEIHPATRGGTWGRLATFWQNVYSWMLIWAFNPASLRGRRPSDLERYWLWISRATLEAKYGPRHQARAHDAYGF
jgi:hypothetical protein